METITFIHNTHSKRPSDKQQSTWEHTNQDNPLAGVSARQEDADCTYCEVWTNVSRMLAECFVVGDFTDPKMEINK